MKGLKYVIEVVNRIWAGRTEVCENCMNMGCKRLLKIGITDSKVTSIVNATYGQVKNLKMIHPRTFTYDFTCNKYQPDGSIE